MVSTRGFAGRAATMADATAWGLEGAPLLPCRYEMKSSGGDYKSG